jgi:D-arabinose 1-dehydrogenase-like Zn-dependent alcohol dehydrogenase
MKALRIHALNDVRLDEVDRPEPASDEVLLRVVAAGLCGSDEHIVDGSTPLPSYPRTLGHEIAGTVETLGSAATGFTPGDRVVVNYLVACGYCEHCLAGRSSLCVRREGLGVVRDGGFAEFVVAPVRNVLSIPEGVTFEHAALATDAFATPWHAISRRARVKAGDGVVVIGAGGLGLAAIELLKIAGAFPIVAIDTSYAALEVARRIGADYALRTDDLDDLQSLSNHGFAHAFDFVGAPATTETATQVIKSGGQATVVGLNPASWRTEAGPLMIRQEKSLVGSYSFDTLEIEEILRFMSKSLIDVDAMIGAYVTLDDLVQLLGDGASSHRGTGRTVVRITG